MYKIKSTENLFLITIILLTILYLYIGNSFWNFFLVPVGDIYNNFTDLKCVQSWSRLYEDFSYNHIIYNDISGCKLNYPNIWVPISKFILSETYTYIYLIICFFFYNFIFYYFIKLYRSYYFIYVYLSGPSLLMLERGNVEIIILIFLFFSIIQKNILKLIFLYTSIILKIFPIFSLISLISKKYKKYLTYSIIFTFIYIFLSFDQFNYIFSNTPSSGDMSYGTAAIVANLERHFGLILNSYILSAIFIILTFVFYIFYFKKKLNKLNYFKGEMYLYGASIYCATFLLGSNHDYRMIFLLFTLPLILNLNLKIFKFTFLILIILSFELHRMIYFFGFFGGVLNTFSKILLYFLLSQISIDIIMKNFYSFNSSKKIKSL